MEFEGSHGQCASQAVPGVRGAGKGSGWTDPSLGFRQEGAVGGREGTEVHDDGENGVWQEGLTAKAEASWAGELRERGETRIGVRARSFSKVMGWVWAEEGRTQTWRRPGVCVGEGSAWGWSQACVSPHSVGVSPAQRECWLLSSRGLRGEPTWEDATQNKRNSLSGFVRERCTQGQSSRPLATFGNVGEVWKTVS